MWQTVGQCFQLRSELVSVSASILLICLAFSLFRFFGLSQFLLSRGTSLSWLVAYEVRIHLASGSGCCSSSFWFILAIYFKSTMIQSIRIASIFRRIRFFAFALRLVFLLLFFSSFFLFICFISLSFLRSSLLQWSALLSVCLGHFMICLDSC